MQILCKTSGPVMCADEKLLAIFKQYKAKLASEWKMKMKNVGMNLNVQHADLVTVIYLNII
jgi:hypothetical protein